MTCNCKRGLGLVRQPNTVEEEPWAQYQEEVALGSFFDDDNRVGFAGIGLYGGHASGHVLPEESNSMREYIMGLGSLGRDMPSSGETYSEYTERCRDFPDDTDCPNVAIRPNTSGSGSGGKNTAMREETFDPLYVGNTTSSGHCATPATDSLCSKRGGACADYAATDSTHRVESCLCAGPAHRRCRIPVGVPQPTPPGKPPLVASTGFFAKYPWLKWALPLTGVAIVGAAFFLGSDEKPAATVNGLGRYRSRRHHRRQQRLW